MFQGTQGFVAIVVSLVVAAVLAVGLCLLKEQVEKPPVPQPLPMARADSPER
jgi:hypothetical protein